MKPFSAALFPPSVPPPPVRSTLHLRPPSPAYAARSGSSKSPRTTETRSTLSLLAPSPCGVIIHTPSATRAKNVTPASGPRGRRPPTIPSRPRHSPVPKGASLQQDIVNGPAGLLKPQVRRPRLGIIWERPSPWETALDEYCPPRQKPNPRFPPSLPPMAPGPPPVNRLRKAIALERRLQPTTQRVQLSGRQDHAQPGRLVISKTKARV